MRVTLTLAALMIATLALAQKPQPTPTPSAPPALTSEQREQVRKFQLDDQRVDSAIKQRQIEIIQLQQQAQMNARLFQEFTAGLCKDAEGKYRFDMASDDLRCVVKPAPAPTPSPKPTPEKK